MRKVFVEVGTVEEVEEECPWAAEIVKAEGGFWCFESVEDAEGGAGVKRRARAGEYAPFSPPLHPTRPFPPAAPAGRSSPGAFGAPKGVLVPWDVQGPAE
jgi:hypothetical protein